MHQHTTYQTLAARLKALSLLLVLTFLPYSSPLLASPNHQLVIIDSQRGEPYSTVRESMLESLHGMGYITNKNITIHYHSMSHYQGAADSIMRRIIEPLGQPIIFLNGTVATAAFKTLAWNNNLYRFVFASVTDPVGLGVIKEFGQAPPANFTGISYPVPVEDRLKLVRQLIPNVRNIGLVFADMPQSHSYIGWINDFLRSSQEWQNIRFHYIQVDFVSSDYGHVRMAEQAIPAIKKLAPLVDVFLSPNDQMGAQKPFAQTVRQHANKPLIGLGRKDVAEHWGAAASRYPSLDQMGKQAANMLHRLFSGQAIHEIYPERPEKYGTILNETLLTQFGITIPASLRETAEIIEKTTVE